MKAHDYVEKLLNECEGNQGEFGIRIKNSLVRLTKTYGGAELEKIITKIIKGEIFSYIFVSAPTYPQEWSALTQRQAYLIIQNPKEKVFTPVCELEVVADIDCLWVIEDEVRRILSHDIDGTGYTSNALDKSSACSDKTEANSNKLNRNRNSEHPQFLEYIKSYINQFSCNGYINMMKESEYVFDNEKLYKFHLQGKNKQYKVDNSHHLVKNVALIKNGKNKHDEDKYLIYYSIEDKFNFLSASSLPRYFKKAKNK
ncbi:TPA: hypothetical protein JBL19_04150 [Legionella pneumophila]|nr:hypothetical protein [Legionella pneumophila]MDW8880636.1 hypothetical protein [Legionella pneumophila subsp. fraseri]MDW8962252.1 hypothetical protein [Legionella pneumophila subsp. fraseri]MDW9034754.1 hypothetical protein [Legionella pneumophila subsp. fraseri]MDW9037570.1 hypothetical protein [Legionella pneumophila subsp. fraseri]MDW9040875.1 hypothetical protein [Legionella pneumophila subsp. fraseri]